MSSLFDVTGDDIASLSDDDLRELVGRLCEADYRRANLSLKGIFWGGHQDAADAGFDVIVEGNQIPPSNSFVPSSLTGFQVRKPKMAPSNIEKEMLKNGILKKEIQKLLKRGGAYVIVSSGDSTTRGKALENRIEAMKKSIASVDGIKSPKIDFLDRGRLATWARQYPAIILWVHRALGKSLSGWKPHGNWANTSTGDADLYLMGKKVRLSLNSEEFDMGAGIGRLRSLLNLPRSNVRLIGLSGVGKTRLVQALFDNRIGDESLNTDLAIYADIADSPNPDPKHLTEQLVAQGDRAILVVDNCSRELHRKLSEAVRRSSSRLSLLTVEYDVREDLPEETSVFRLEPTEEELLRKLLEREFPHLGYVNACSIARVSGGNFRVAIYIAKTVGAEESIGVLKDDELFQRLFQQHHHYQGDLLESAEILSLLYSFDGENTEDSDSELKLLSELGEMSVQVLYKHSQEITGRELIQKRGKWRALLPHAVANNLAKRALRKIPPSIIQSKILYQGSERILTSFSRRISYLHDSEEAVKMVSVMLEDDGWLGQHMTNLSPFGFRVLENLSPVAPIAVLEAIERIKRSELATSFFTRQGSHAQGFVKILFHLAYEDKFFQRAAYLLAVYASEEEPEERNNSIRERLRTLFKIYLSGSHASAATRQATLKGLLGSSEENIAETAAQVIPSTLMTGHFTGMYAVEFGARFRDHGSHPHTRAEFEEWYRPFMKIALDFTVSSKPGSMLARRSLANSFRGLWDIGFEEECEVWVDTLLRNSSWVEGWRAVKATLYYGKDRLNEESKLRLLDLGKRLRPRNLEDKFEYYILGGGVSVFDFEDDGVINGDHMAAVNRAEEIAQEIGTDIGSSEDLLLSVVQRCVSGKDGRHNSFGLGLAKSKLASSQTWKILTQAFHSTPEENRNIGVLRGFVWGISEKDEKFYQSILDRVLADKDLRVWLIIFQRISMNTERSLQRLHRLLDENLVPVWRFYSLGHGRCHEAITDIDLIALLEKINEKDEGDEVVLDILGMRFYGEENRPEDLSSEMGEFGRRFLYQLKFEPNFDRNSTRDHSLARVIEFCYFGGNYREDVESFSSRLIEQSGYSFNFGDFDDSLKSLAKVDPIALLNTLVSNQKTTGSFQKNYRVDSVGSETFLSGIDEKILTGWLEIDPRARCSEIARHIQMFQNLPEDELQWTHLALELIRLCPDFSEILNIYAARIRPDGSIGYIDKSLESQLILLESLPVENGKKQILSERIHAIRADVQSQREYEAERNRNEYQSFE